MAGPLNPNAGRRIYPDVPDIIESPVEPISSRDLGRLPRQYMGQINYLEEQADEALHATLGKSYQEDPFTIPLHRLPTNVRGDFLNRIDELTGMKKLIMQGQGPTMFRGYTKSNPDGTIEYERSPAGRFVFNQGEFMGNSIDPRILRMSQQTARYDHARSILMTERYYSAGTHYRQRVLNNLQHQIDTKISTDVVEGTSKRAGNVLVFDVETPGLNPEEGIWQISARMLHGNGQYTDLTRSFDNPRMRWGGEVGQTRQSLQNFLNPQGVTDYEAGMRDFLQMASQADYIAGHNVLFDYRMVRHGLVNTPAYKADQSFKDLADTFMHKFYNPETQVMGNIIDTNQLSRAFLHNISLAPELVGGPSPHQYSMQNILLQTNLLARVKSEIGEGAVSDMLSRGTHFADVDVPLEGYLLKYLQEGAQGGLGLTQYSAGEFGEMTPEERSAIVNSRAFTPNLPLSNPDYLHPLALEKARQAGILEEGNTNISPLENMVIASRSLHEGSIPTTSSSQLGHFWDRFKLNSIPEDTAAMANHAGMWNRIFGSNVTQSGTLRRNLSEPSPEEWAHTQEALERANLPLPGLSWIERHLTATLGVAGGAANPEERNIRSLFGADVAPLGRFFGAEEIGVVGKSQITKVPMSIMEDWERHQLDMGKSVSTAFTNPGEKAQFLHGSFFNINGHSEMGLFAQINEDEKSSLLEFLKQHPSVASNDELMNKLENSFAANTGKYGVQVGTLTNLRGGMGVENVRSAFEQVMGIGADTSDQTPMIQLPYVGRNILDEEGGKNSLYTMGAMINTSVLDDEEKDVIARSTAAGIERYRQLAQISDSPLITLLTHQAEQGTLSDMGSARKMLNAYSRLRENAPLLGIAAGVVGYGYYRHRKKEKQANVNAVMALQPTSPNPYQSSGLVQQLDQKKIGHTVMGPSKYNYLFGAGYS